MFSTTPPQFAQDSRPLMSYALNVFVSSMCYELRDLRSAVSAWLTEMGMQPLLSDEEGFPRRGNLLPYVSCLVALEECPLVIGVIDRQYGTRFNDWGPYPQYAGLSPTHAELRHALERKKKLLLYIHKDTLSFYEVWRKGGLPSLPKGLEIGTLELVKELKLSKPTPWIETFTDAQAVVRSLKKNLVNEVYTSLQEQEKQSTDLAKYILELVSAAPDARSKIEQNLNPALRVQLDGLQLKLEEVEATRRLEQQTSQKQLEALNAAKAEIEREILNVRADLGRATSALVAAAIKDASWLSMVRSQFMPKQQGRVPFHNDAEVAIRGYHCSNIRGAPKLKEVTWSKLPYLENNLHRGYHAGLIFRGTDFAPGITFTSRQIGEITPPAGHTDYRWRQPRIYFGDYLEVPSGNDEFESPLGYRNTEFCVRNPEGECSEWVRFSYAYDEGRLRAILKERQEEGERLFSEKKFSEAIEPLRKAMVFSERLDSATNERTRHLSELWNKALDGKTLSRCRFSKGARIKVVRGEHVGLEGQIEAIGLRNSKPYWIRADGSAPGNAGLVAVSDDEVESADAERTG
jgi:uncharacterized protein DUF4062